MIAGEGGQVAGKEMASDNGFYHTPSGAPFPQTVHNGRSNRAITLRSVRVTADFGNETRAVYPFVRHSANERMRPR
jgi:hypothetical protein